ncbi:MAG TPA: PspC domain-containing protein [Sphingobium sp.]|nr:PspC domain-containing protein [Sphingobium sp.]
MQTYQPSLIARNDTLLGVCEAIGEDFGFNPIWLRAAFAVTVFFNLFLAVGIYLAVGVVVLFTRRLHPSPRRLVVVPQVGAVEQPALEHTEGDGENEDRVLLAAA